MLHDAGVGRKKTDARIPSACLAATLLPDLPRSFFCTSHLLALFTLTQEGPLATRHLLALTQKGSVLPGSGLRAECDVTNSKQTTPPFLPGARIATRGLRQGTALAVSN